MSVAIVIETGQTYIISQSHGLFEKSGFLTRCNLLTQQTPAP